MNASETLISRNDAFAAERFSPELRMMPALRTIVIGCVDPRVDPGDVLGAAPGDVAVVRNVGGRITPSVVEELVMLRKVTQAAGGDLGPGWELVVLQHTDCGITRLAGETELLAGFFGVDADRLHEHSVSDPHAAVLHDLAVLRAEPRLAGAHVSGLVYDVATGRVERVAESA